MIKNRVFIPFFNI